MRCKSSSEVYRHRGSKIVGIWSRPLETSPRFPAVLFLHGFPGSEKNVDVQRELLRRGIGAFAVHFRGAWGSEGTFRFSQLIDDARAAWAFMRRLPGVDRRRTAVFGFSMGGWTALHLSALERGCRAVAAVAPVGGPEMLRPGARDRIAWLARPLKAPPASELFRDFAESVRRHDPAVSIACRRCPLLLVQGGRDEIVPPPVAKRLFSLAAEPKRLLWRADAHHDFLESRAWLTRRVCAWLGERLR